MRIKADNNTKFWVLFDTFISDRKKADIIEQILNKISIRKVKVHTHIGLGAYVHHSLRVQFKKWYLDVNGNTIRFGQGESFYYLREHIDIIRVITLLKSNFKLSAYNKKAIKQFLDGKKNWNFVILKSIRE